MKITAMFSVLHRTQRPSIEIFLIMQTNLSFFQSVLCSKSMIVDRFSRETNSIIDMKSKSRQGHLESKTQRTIREHCFLNEDKQEKVNFTKFSY